MDEQFRLLLRKRVYPYKYMDDWEKFKENHLPPIEAFYNKLNLSRISECNYGHAQIVWREFGMKDLGDCHDLYLKMDVLLLSNVFETFRMTCLDHYTLDPTHFYTSLRLAWEACLKKTEVSLELLTDPNMLLMFEQGTRGGITQVVHRYAQVNNKYMGDRFDPGKESHYFQYLDGNNVYGWAIVQKLPAGQRTQINLRATSVSWLRKLGRVAFWRLMFLTPTICTSCTTISHSCVRGRRSMESKSWSLICMTRRSM